MRTELLAVSLLVLFGCASSEEVPLEGPLGPGTKIVTGKVDPSTLVAVDGTICNVTPLKFRDAAIGDGVWCDWRRRSEGPPRGSADQAVGACAACGRSGEPAAAIWKLVSGRGSEGDLAPEVVARRVATLETAGEIGFAHFDR